jgi:hypothetical protein
LKKFLITRRKIKEEKKGFLGQEGDKVRGDLFKGANDCFKGMTLKLQGILKLQKNLC